MPLREATAYSYAQSADGLDVVDAEVAGGARGGTRRAPGRPRRRRRAVPRRGRGGARRPARARPGRAHARPRRPGGASAAAASSPACGRSACARPIPCRCARAPGVLTAGQVLIATGAPMLGRGLYWAKTSGSRSLLLSFAPPSSGRAARGALPVGRPARRSIRSAVVGRRDAPARGRRRPSRRTRGELAASSSTRSPAGRARGGPRSASPSTGPRRTTSRTIACPSSGGCRAAAAACGSRRGTPSGGSRTAPPRRSASRTRCSAPAGPTGHA